jgi:hypothetical protein
LGAYYKPVFTIDTVAMIGSDGSAVTTAAENYRKWEQFRLTEFNNANQSYTTCLANGTVAQCIQAEKDIKNFIFQVVDDQKGAKISELQIKRDRLIFMDDRTPAQDAELAQVYEVLGNYPVAELPEYKQFFHNEQPVILEPLATALEDAQSMLLEFSFQRKPLINTLVKELGANRNTCFSSIDNAENNKEQFDRDVARGNFGSKTTPEDFCQDFYANAEKLIELLYKPTTQVPNYFNVSQYLVTSDFVNNDTFMFHHLAGTPAEIMGEVFGTQRYFARQADFGRQKAHYTTLLAQADNHQAICFEVSKPGGIDRTDVSQCHEAIKIYHQIADTQRDIIRQSLTVNDANEVLNRAEAGLLTTYGWAEDYGDLLAMSGLPRTVCDGKSIQNRYGIQPDLLDKGLQAVARDWSNTAELLADIGPEELEKSLREFAQSSGEAADTYLKGYVSGKFFCTVDKLNRDTPYWSTQTSTVTAKNELSLLSSRFIFGPSLFELHKNGARYQAKAGPVDEYRWLSFNNPEANWSDADVARFIKYRSESCNNLGRSIAQIPVLLESYFMDVGPDGFRHPGQTWQERCEEGWNAIYPSFYEKKKVYRWEGAFSLTGYYKEFDQEMLPLYARMEADRDFEDDTYHELLQKKEYYEDKALATHNAPTSWATSAKQTIGIGEPLSRDQASWERINELLSQKFQNKIGIDTAVKLCEEATADDDWGLPTFFQAPRKVSIPTVTVEPVLDDDLADGGHFKGYDAEGNYCFSEPKTTLAKVLSGVLLVFDLVGQPALESASYAAAAGNPVAGGVIRLGMAAISVGEEYLRQTIKKQVNWPGSDNFH